MRDADDGLLRDLAAFIRYGRLDAYELTDEELAKLLEVWRWHVWTRGRGQPAADQAVIAAVRDLQRRLAQTDDIETEYNTAILLKQEIEALMHLRQISEAGRSFRYLLRPWTWLAVLRAWRQVRRYRSLPPAIDGQGGGFRYPDGALARFNGRAPNLLRRKYWRPIGGASYEERKRTDAWW